MTKYWKKREIFSSFDFGNFLKLMTFFFRAYADTLWFLISWFMTNYWKKRPKLFLILIDKKTVGFTQSPFFQRPATIWRIFSPYLICLLFLAIFYNFWLLFCRVYTVVSPSPASVSLSTVACISVSTIPWSQFFWEQMHLFFGHSCWDGELPSFPVRISFKSFK